MIDPFLSLALSIQSNKGVYALLIGSGVSRSAGILTGWEVVLDLIKKLAHLRNADYGQDPAAWYTETYSREPLYDELLNAVARTQAERRNLLRPYFEPTDEEKEQGLKVPQDAHRAISELVKGGYVRVIITTNFDRLLEKALENEGINPTVIMTSDGVQGALPLIHTDCTIIKVNGDYLDTRIRNTPQELTEYDEATNRLLDEVFDQFGLIVCGWSADWDVALCRAIERCRTRRFSFYWTLVGQPSVAADRLIQFRQAIPIQIAAADSFFRDLTERVFSIEDLTRQHPLSARVVAQRIKNYIADDRHQILLHDLVTKETDALYDQISEERFPLTSGFTENEFRSRVQQYEALTETMRAIMASGCYWGREIHENLWPRALERIACPSFTWRGGTTSIPRLTLYPALVLLYSGGIAALAANKYDMFSSLLLNTRCRLLNEYVPIILGVNIKEATAESGNFLQESARYVTPVSEHLLQLLRDVLHEYLPDDRRYVEMFDYFEYLVGLVFAHLWIERGHMPWLPLGSFTWRYQNDGPNSPMSRLDAELARLGQQLPLLLSGLFNGSLETLQTVKATSDRLISEQAFHWRMRG